MMNGLIQLVFDRDIYQRVVEEAICHATRTVWIATADLKDMHVEMARGYRPILEVFEALAKQGIRFRIIHAKMPSGPFRATLEKLPALTRGGLELQICPRSHWKTVIVDHAFGYFGSANFTGAGMGAKREGRRNIEVGAVSRDPEIVTGLAARFDAFWMGDDCRTCAFRATCPDPI